MWHGANIGHHIFEHLWGGDFEPFYQKTQQLRRGAKGAICRQKCPHKFAVCVPKIHQLLCREVSNEIAPRKVMSLTFFGCCLNQPVKVMFQSIYELILTRG